MKKKIAKDVATVRQEIKERDELLEKQPGTKQTVEMSANIRRKLKEINIDAHKLSTEHRQAVNRKKIKNSDEIEKRNEVVDLVFQHVEECELLEKKRYTDKADRGNLFAVQRAPAARATPTQTELADIDEEVAEGLQQLKDKDQEIDKDLDEISAGVTQLKNIAMDMQDEVKMQAVMVDEITNKVDHAHAHIKNINKKMKQTISKVRS